MALMTFIKIVAVSPRVLVCFFEGNDVKYYGPRLKMLKRDLDWQPVTCGGKVAVLQVYGLISKHEVYSNANVAYFVDRDYSLTPLPDDSHKVYCTPCYSVENLYVSEVVMEAILQGEFGLSRFPDERGSFAACLTAFNERFTEFLEAAAILDAWVYAQRRKEAASGGVRTLDASLIKLSQLFSIECDKVQAAYSMFDLETQTGCFSAVP